MTFWGQTRIFAFFAFFAFFFIFFIFFISLKEKQYGWQKLKGVMFDSCNLVLID